MRTVDVEQLLAQGQVTPVFQPVVAVGNGEIHGYEAFIRGPEGTPLHSPLALLNAADAQGRLNEFELQCCRLQASAFLALELPGKLFLNMGADTIVQMQRRDGLRFLLDQALAPSRVVIEITELAHVDDPQSLGQALRELRKLGTAFALDDFGEGHSSLRLWVELLPELVKIDKFFCQGVHIHSAKLEAMRLLLRYAAGQGTRLVAEGVEHAEDLAVIRDLGIELVQGFLLARPSARPQPLLEGPARQLLRSREVSVYPEASRVPIHRATAGKLLVPAPAVAPDASNNEVMELFRQQPEAQSVAVVNAGKPLGLINRRHFVDRYAMPFHRELYGRRSCTQFMNDQPLLVDKSSSLESLTRVLTGEDQRYLAEGFIVTDGGRYLGVGTGEALVRAVTELRIEAARYANPLTFLPGNIPISEHIDRLLQGAARFAACYFDLNNFKPYNDQYGYWRGDEMIKLAAVAITQACDPLRDFAGHVGGDDFVVLFQSADWHARCIQIVQRFNAEATRLFSEADRQLGGIRGEDRQGHPAFFPLTTIAVGVVDVHPGDFRTHEQVASAAAAAKRIAKHNQLGLWVWASGVEEPQASAAGPVAAAG
ncbi:MAG: EAL domain-containing protein [Nevskia sp.]|nr:EAL domain-containing protein [Nevskia sp.]